jgi:hypothetical protein
MLDMEMRRKGEEREEGEKDWFLLVRWAHIYSILLRLALPESAKRKLESTG